MSQAPVARVMVADSDVLVRAALAEYLRSCGFAVIEAADSEEAVAVLGEAPLAVDLVLCDASLRGTLGGFGLKRYARANHPDIDIRLAGSLPAAADAAAEICEQGPMLARPWEPQAVVAHIKQMRARVD